jgi:hypothetical protein
MTGGQTPERTDPTPPAAGAARVDRIAAAGAQAALERLRESDLLAAGAVNLIGLEAIRTQLAERWEPKRSRVWEHVEREIERTVGPAGVFVRLDDVSYLLALSGVTGFAARATCLTVLQDVLRFFLGELKPADIDMRNVTAISDSEIVSSPVDVARLRGPPPAQPSPAVMAGAAAAPRAGDPMSAASIIGGPLDQAGPAPDWKPPLGGRSLSRWMEPPKHPPFELRISVEPVWNLRRGVITSFLLDHTGAPAESSAAVHEEIDVAVFSYAAGVLDEHARQGGPLVLHVPVHFTSLATQRTRLRLLSLTQSVREAMRRYVLLEIRGLDAGVPPSRLIEVSGLVRSLCAGVLGRVRPSRAALTAVRGCGLRGVVIEAPLLAPQAPDGEARLKAFVAAAQPLSPNLIIHGLPTPGLIDAATAAGVSHASAAPEPVR